MKDLDRMSFGKICKLVTDHLPAVLFLDKTHFLAIFEALRDFTAAMNLMV